MKCFVFCFLCESNIGIFQRGIDGDERRIGFWGRNEVEFGKLLIKEWVRIWKEFFLCRSLVVEGW